MKLLSGYHLLIAEDNPTNQIVVAKMIEQLGGTFDMASDGVEAIKIFDPKKHDLALLDIEMPKKSGLEVIRYIRERADTSADFPIIALTAFVLSEHRSKIRDTGADAIIAKPIVDIQKFGEEISTHLPTKSNPDFDAQVLENLRASMGKDVMPELIASLKIDLQNIQGEMNMISSADNQAQMLQSSAHSLASLASMAGALKLTAQSQDVEKRVAQGAEIDCANEAEQLSLGISELLLFLEAQNTND